MNAQRRYDHAEELLPALRREQAALRAALEQVRGASATLAGALTELETRQLPTALTAGAPLTDAQVEALARVRPGHQFSVYRGPHGLAISGVIGRELHLLTGHYHYQHADAVWCGDIARAIGAVVVIAKDGVAAEAWRQELAGVVR